MTRAQSFYHRLTRLGCWASKDAPAQPGGEVIHQIALGGAALNGKPRCDDFFPDYVVGHLESPAHGRGNATEAQ